MTRPPEPGGHLDLDTIADLDADLLPAESGSAATTHLTGCPDCRSRQAGLRTTRALLSTLPAEPMPQPVADRIATALDEAAATRATIVPTSTRRRRWFAHPTVPGLAAAFTAAALVAAVVVGVVHQSHKHPTSALSPQGPTGAAANRAPSYPVTASGRDYSKADIPTLVPRLLVSPPATVGGAAPVAGTVPPALRRLYTSRVALDACIAELTAGGPAQQPIAVDFARYAGHPAVVVVLPGLAPANVDAWVVGPGCTRGQDALLLYESVRRPAG